MGVGPGCPLPVTCSVTSAHRISGRANRFHLFKKQRRLAAIWPFPLLDAPLGPRPLLVHLPGVLAPLLWGPVLPVPHVVLGLPLLLVEHSLELSGRAGGSPHTSDASPRWRGCYRTRGGGALVFRMSK